MAKVMSERLFEGLPAREVWLFGSQARGEVTEDSDIDLLAVVSDSEMSRYRRAITARRLVRDFHVAKDIMVLTQEEWERELKVPTSLPSTVRREGLRLLP